VTADWLAVAALAVAAVAILAAVLAWRALRSVRASQQVLVGSAAKADFVEFAVSLQARMDDLYRAVDELAAGLARVDRRVDGALARLSVVRYDAYADTGGQQSASVALLDAGRSGVVLTAIQGRDYARIYVKQLERGRASIGLSPEEQEAVERAMSQGPLAAE
jgi:hypothetical protein